MTDEYEKQRQADRCPYVLLAILAVIWMCGGALYFMGRQ